MKNTILLFTLLGFAVSGCFLRRHAVTPPGESTVQAFPSQQTPVPATSTDSGVSVSLSTEAGTMGSVASPAASPTEAVSVAAKPGQVRATFHFRNMRLEEILKIFSKESGANFITDEKVRGMTFTAYFQNVTIREALDSLLSSRGLSYEQYTESNIYVVRQRTDTKTRTVTRLFRLNNILLGSADAGGGSAKSSGFSFVDTSAKAGGGGASGGGAGSSSLVSVLQGMLSESGKIQTEPFTNSLIITEIPDRFPQLEKLIEELDVRSPQVNIEVQVVEVNSSKLRRVGLQYGLADGTLAKIFGPAQALQFPKLNGNWFGSSTSGTGGSGSYSGLLSLQELGVVLRALETSGAGEYLARPNIMTLNNKPAVLSVTSDTAVGIQSASMISQAGLLATTAERYRTGITLRVTPQVSNDDWILLQISPTISRPSESEFYPGQFVDPTDVNLNTSVRVKAGETVLLGGLYITQKNKSVRRLPVLGSIPLISSLFKTSEKTFSKNELMIFITPRIVGR